MNPVTFLSFRTDHNEATIAHQYFVLCSPPTHGRGILPWPCCCWSRHWSHRCRQGSHPWIYSLKRSNHTQQTKNLHQIQTQYSSSTTKDLLHLLHTASNGIYEFRKSKNVLPQDISFLSITTPPIATVTAVARGLWMILTPWSWRG